MAAVAKPLFCPIILTYNSRSDLMKIANSISKSAFLTKFKGVSRPVVWQIPGRDAGLIMFEVEEHNMVIVGIFVNRKDLKNSEYYEKFIKNEKCPVLISDVGARANVTDIINDIKRWKDMEKPFLKKGLEAGEDELGIVLKTYKGEDDPYTIATRLVSPGVLSSVRIGRLITKEGAKKNIKLLSLRKDLKVKVLVTKFDAGNFISITIFFDNTNMQYSDYYKKMLKRGLVYIPIADVGVRANWKDLVRNAADYYLKDTEKFK